MVENPKDKPVGAAPGPKTAGPIPAEAPRTPADLAMLFVRLVEDFQHSVYDFDRLHAMHRRNLQSLADFNQMTFSSMQSFARRQTEIMRQTTSMFSKAALDMMQARSPAEIAERQMATAGEAFRLAREEMNRLARLLAKADAAPDSAKPDETSAGEVKTGEVGANAGDGDKPAVAPAPTIAAGRRRVKPVTRT